MFLLILSLTVLAFGVINQVMLEPRAPFDAELMNKVLYRPYFQMYGELFLEDYEHAGKLHANHSFKQHKNHICPDEK